MNIYTPILFTIFGLPLLAVMWTVKKVTGRTITEGQAWGVLFAAFLVVFWVSGWWLAPS